MIRRVISILIALAGAGLLYTWWERGHEPSAPSLSPVATVLNDAGLEDDPTPAATGGDDSSPVDASSVGDEGASAATGPDTGTDEDPAAGDGVETEADDAVWEPTPVVFDQSDRNATTVMLQRADAALAQGLLVEPPGESAIDLYFSVLDAAPKNARARDGLGRALDQLTLVIRQALDRGDYPTAADNLPVLEVLRPDEAEPIRMRQRVDAAEPQRIALRRAARAIERGRIDSGARDAVGYYRAVLEIEPGNATAREGLSALQQRLLAEAQSAGTAGDFAAADALLERAGAIDPEALQVLTDARSAVAATRTEAASSLLRDAHQQLDNGVADAAEALLERAIAIDPDNGGVGLVRERVRNVRLYGGFGEGERFRDAMGNGGEGPMMVVIPVGSFLMGSPDDEGGRRANEGPQFRVRFDRGFAIAESEITVGEYRRFVEAVGHRGSAEANGNSSIYDERSGSMRDRSDIDWRHDETGRIAADDRPVVHVGWNDAVAYARWLAESTAQPYRLPSEAEFEYALRAGSGTRYPWGNDAPSQPVANVSTAGDRSGTRREWSNAFPGQSDGYFGIAPVRSYSANDFAVHDLVGNVSEWVEDCWHSTYSRAPSDGRAWVNPGCGRRVVRGASWASGPDQVRSAYRLSIAPTTTSPRVGFRVARSF
jgi:formylglycine-generating enzyme required for sulfatase activity